jgi:hypothetical protein
MRLRLLAACVALVAQESPLGAQEIRAQEARVDAVRVLIQRAEAIERVFRDSMERATNGLDTVLVPPLRLLVAPGLRSRTARVAAPAAEQLSRRLGSVASQLNQDWIVVKSVRRDNNDTVTLGLKGERNGTVVERLWGVVDDSTLSHWIHDNASDLFARRLLGAHLLAWSRSSAGAGLALDTVLAREWVALRFDFVESPTVVSRRCFGGDIAACMSALELTPTSDPALEWYDAAGRHEYVYANWVARAADRAGARRCSDGDDASCLSVLRNLFRDHQPHPDPVAARMTLVRLAVQLGGVGAYDRLLATTGEPSVRLAATARVPIDSIVRVWLQRTREARVASDSLSVQIAVGSIAWILACGALALRSSRWR